MVARSAIVGDDDGSLSARERHDFLVWSRQQVVFGDVAGLVAGGSHEVNEPSGEVLVDQEPHALSR